MLLKKGALPRMAEAVGWTVDEAASLLGAVPPTLERWRQE